MENTKQDAKEKELGEKLVAAGKKAEKQKAARRERVVKGSHLLTTLQEKATAREFLTEEKSGFYKVTAPGQKGRAIYIARKGGRLDLSGFTVEHPAFIQISEEDAKQKHLGKVRAQLDFSKDDDTVLKGYEAALEVLATTAAPTDAK